MKYSVFDLQKTPEGRKFLERQQKAHEIDMLQPSDPRFHKVYGDKLKRDEATRQKQAQEAREAKIEAAERAKREGIKRPKQV